MRGDRRRSRATRCAFILNLIRARESGRRAELASVAWPPNAYGRSRCQSRDSSARLRPGSTPAPRRRSRGRWRGRCRSGCSVRSRSALPPIGAWAPGRVGAWAQVAAVASPMGWLRYTAPPRPSDAWLPAGAVSPPLQRPSTGRRSGRVASPDAAIISPHDLPQDAADPPSRRTPRRLCYNPLLPVTHRLRPLLGSERLLARLSVNYSDSKPLSNKVPAQSMAQRKPRSPPLLPSRQISSCTAPACPVAHWISMGCSGRAGNDCSTPELAMRPSLTPQLRAKGSRADGSRATRLTVTRPSASARSAGVVPSQSRSGAGEKTSAVLPCEASNAWMELPDHVNTGSPLPVAWTLRPSTESGYIPEATPAWNRTSTSHKSSVERDCSGFASAATTRTRDSSSKWHRRLLKHPGVLTLW